MYGERPNHLHWILVIGGACSHHFANADRVICPRDMSRSHREYFPTLTTQVLPHPEPRSEVPSEYAKQSLAAKGNRRGLTPDKGLV